MSELLEFVPPYVGLDVNFQDVVRIGRLILFIRPDPMRLLLPTHSDSPGDRMNSHNNPA